MDARSNQRIRAQRFSFDGSKKGPEFRVNTTDGFHHAPIATRLVNGNYVIAWRSDPSPPGGGALILRIFDLAGSPIVGETRPNLSGFTGQKAMTFLDDNDRFSACAATIVVPGEGETAFVAWADDSRTGGDPSDFAVRGRVLQSSLQGDWDD